MKNFTDLQKELGGDELKDLLDCTIIEIESFRKTKTGDLQLFCRIQQDIHFILHIEDHTGDFWWKFAAIFDGVAMDDNVLFAVKHDKDDNLVFQNLGTRSMQ